MEYSHVKKIIVAPQIVIYKNIFQYSKEIIKLLDKDSKNSLFTKSRDWHGQGFRKDVIYNKQNIVNNKDSKNIKIEKKYLKEISDIADFINKDYFKDFEKEKGIWPNFIEDWDKLKTPESHYDIDYFHYVLSLEKSIKTYQGKEQYLMMGYHVDEFSLKNEEKKERHVVTINYYLNDKYSGGEICTYDSISKKIYKYKPVAGDVVVMPSTAPFYHAVLSYDKTDRYFLRTFINYKDPKEWTDEYHLEEGQLDEKINMNEEMYNEV
jgi:hypothetical protein